MRNTALIFVVLFTLLVGCDRQESEPPAPPTTTAEAAAESVEELVAKLPNEAPKPAPPPADVQTFGRFGTNAALPTPQGDQLTEVDAKAVAELNMVAQFRVESAFAERNVDPSESVIVQFGGEDSDGLLVTIRYQGKAASRKIPPASSGPELVSNLDHTVDRLLDELGVARKR